MSQDDSVRNEERSTLMCKRRLFVLDKSHNEIYITSRSPLCVYYKRAIYLLRWQLSRFPELCTSRFVRENQLNKKTGVLGNRAKLLAQHTESNSISCDTTSISSVLSKRHEPEIDTCGSGVILYGTGRCVTRALYVLQDIYDYVKDLYIEAQSRFRGCFFRVLCDECSISAQCISEGRVKHGLEASCAECDSCTNAALETAVKRILRVEITTGTVSCSDDVYSYSAEKDDLSSFPGPFNPLDSLDTEVSVSKRERMVSSIRISIRVVGT
ncbi:uncharacterized protein BXIN_2849 [Babesia sp. Xinjiang]|uniref:uncharacterized protein n=1 Tax=Babesia sp. Xinjiang TaxID=462227 RepID=UPI000A21D499|nr:uncharacterized protein BXIN_2849 [Babesia sp. Xinjiang]ORM39521.1 hypothetical protein BXIN_2849 [Babesia sp. Xinjiang]